MDWKNLISARVVSLTVSLAFLTCGCATDRIEGYSPGQCSDGIDNDSDGLLDCDDPNCSTAPDCLSADDDDLVGCDDPAIIATVDSIRVQGIDLVRLCSGSFEMGCTSGQSSCQPDESPSHTVSITRDFWLGATEVTQGQWQMLVANNPSINTACGPSCPVEQVNWFEAAALANAVSAAESLAECYSFIGCSSEMGEGLDCSSVEVNSVTGSPYDCEGYRLPTEAEWEFAARAGTDLLYAGSGTIDDVGWFEGNSDSSSQPVAEKTPNRAGLWDMSGNVWEWTWDWYDAEHYNSEPQVDPLGPISGELRSYRGGAWYAPAEFTRVTVRNHSHPNSTSAGHGLRLARTIR